LFIFDALDGTISAWNSSLTDAQVMVNNSASGAVYSGLAIDSNGTGNFILAANLAANTIDVFDTKFAPTSLSGKFSDPTLPPGYAPFNVHVFNGQVYVMYALQTAGGGLLPREQVPDISISSTGAAIFSREPFQEGI
jgi:uncharacterized protein (TIGR03118 family)